MLVKQTYDCIFPYHWSCGSFAGRAGFHITGVGDLFAGETTLWIPSYH